RSASFAVPLIDPSPGSASRMRGGLSPVVACPGAMDRRAKVRPSATSARKRRSRAARLAAVTRTVTQASAPTRFFRLLLGLELASKTGGKRLPGRRKRSVGGGRRGLWHGPRWLLDGSLGVHARAASR